MPKGFKRTLEELIVFLDRRTIKDKNTGCWLYNGRLYHGYGQVSYNGRHQPIARISYHYHYPYFKLESKNFICHITTCFNKNCWNPQHLYEGNATSNNMDMKVVKALDLKAKVGAKGQPQNVVLRAKHTTISNSLTKADKHDTMEAQIERQMRRNKKSWMKGE